MANRLYIVSMYQDPETQQMQLGYAISDIQAYCLESVVVNNRSRFFLGVVDEIVEMFDPSLDGDGWDGKTMFFEIMLGNEANFVYWHSLRLDGDLNDLTISIRDYGEDVADARTLTIGQDTDTGGAWFGMVDEYGKRKILRFTFDTSSDEARQINNLQVYYTNSRRGI